MTDIMVLQQDARKRHQEVLNMIESLSDAASLDRVSSVSNFQIFEKTTHNFHADKQSLFRLS
jgi:hypothetical protein